MIQVIPQTERGIDFGAIGQGIGGGAVQGFEQAQDTQLLDQLLSQARGSGLETSQLIENILSSDLSSDRQKLAIDTLQKSEKLKIEARPPEPKLGEFEKVRLKDLAEREKKLPGVLTDLDRADELLDEGVSTGPIKGRVAKYTIKSGSQQELEGISARLLTSSFATLPRIRAEFESFKEGQLSLLNTPDVNRRLVANQRKAAVLDQKKISLFHELRKKGASEAAALNRATQETEEEEEKLLLEIRETRQQAQSGSRETREAAIQEARSRGLI